MGALIYEITLLNKIQLIMCHTVYSLATTLAAYMSDLALGAEFQHREPGDFTLAEPFGAPATLITLLV